MTHYFPSDEPATERLLFISRSPELHGFGHLQATIVRRAQSHYVDPDSSSGRMVYCDDANATGYRNATWHTSNNKTGVLVDDFAVRCQITVREYDGTVPTEFKPYGSSHQFSTVYKVEEQDCERMLKTFKLINKKMKSIAEDHGDFSDRDFATHCRRVALALGIKKFITVSRFGNGTSLDVADNYREGNMSEIGYTVDSLCEQYGK